MGKGTWTKKSLKKYFERTISDNYRESTVGLAAQEKALSAAIQAADKATNAALAASEKAVIKAENAQKEYNARSNEFRAALDDNQKTLISRAEAEVKFAQITKDIDEIKQGKSRGEGKEVATSYHRQQSNWIVGLVIVIVLAVVELLVGIWLKK